MKLSEVLKKGLALAETIRDYWDRELPRRHPDYPLVNPGEDSGPPPPEEQELREFLSGLPAEMLYKFASVVFFGRGNRAPSTLAEQYQALQERYDTPEEMVFKLVDTGSLADSLSFSLEQLNKRKINLDKISFTPATTRK